MATQQEPGGPLSASLLPLTIPISWLYRAAVAIRNHRFDGGRGVERIRLPVISVGNLTTGGTGKSPMVAWICEALRAAGHHPVIAMRGYGARGEARSDEHAEYTERLPRVPVVAGPNRVAALREVLPEKSSSHGVELDPSARDWPEIDCVVLDDGLQHRVLARDLDLVLIDATRGTMGERLLPAGHLREPVASLRRADAVVVTRAAGVNEALSRAIQQHHGRPPVAWCRERWTILSVMSTSGAIEVPSDWLRGKRVLLVLGVGHPGAVERMLVAHEASIADRSIEVDHRHYRSADVQGLRARCGLPTIDAMFTTLKDWVKMRSLIDPATWPVPIVVPRLELDVFAGAEPLRQLILEAARARGQM